VTDDRRSTKFDFVTVFHAEDAFQMVLQARSFARFVPEHLVGQILIIFNDVEHDGWRDAIEQSVLPAYGNLDHLVTLRPASDLSPAVDPRGWHGQQVLKLTSARDLLADHYVILDAKNHFIRHVTSDCFMDQTGKPLMGFEPVASSLQKYFTASLAAFALSPENHLAHAASPVTPFVMPRHLVLEMMASIEAREGNEFSRYFLVNNGLLTEFFLYYGYILSRFDDPLIVHSPRVSGIITLFRRWPDTREKFRWAAARVQDPRTFCFGLHRGRLSHMSDDERAFVRDLWMETGLVADARQADAFLRAPA
jgi:Family of unknown function (DUF6492)